MAEEHVAEAQGLFAEFLAYERVALCGAVALVEEEVPHRLHRGEAGRDVRGRVEVGGAPPGAPHAPG